MKKALSLAFAEMQSDPQLAALCRPQHGIEKEGLRVDRKGRLARTVHPRDLGSALTNPRITIDFSEAQLELITGVHDTSEAMLGELQRIHQYAYSVLDGELIWPTSMPCDVGEEAQIPEGQFGSSNIGRIKRLYRLGLGVRYGRAMQTISGIHFNFSLPDAFWGWLAQRDGSEFSIQDIKNHCYLALTRNFRRHSWLLLYLLGASPAVCKSFMAGRSHRFAALEDATLMLPHATSLRMGRFGYQSSAQATLQLSCNSLNAYARSLGEAVITPFPPYQALGIRDGGGGYVQLHDAILQIENELYGVIRPKQPILSGERPLNALLQRGVEYVEVRCLDINPFLTLGIDDETVRFLNLFLLWCMFSESPPDTPDEDRRHSVNRLLVVDRGRDPSLRLFSDAGERLLRDMGKELLEACRPIAALCDRGVDSGCQAALERQEQKLSDPDLTPSAAMLNALREEKVSFLEFGMSMAERHARWFANLPISKEVLAGFREEARLSLAQQESMEAAEQPDFETFRLSYIQQARDALLRIQQEGEV